MKNENLILGHEHAAEEDDYAEGAIVNKYISRFVNKHTFFVAKILTALSIFDKQKLDKLAVFLKYTNKTQLQNIKSLLQNFPTGTKAVILSLDQHYLNKGKVPRTYEAQLKELVCLKMAGDPIIIYFFAEPRDPNNFELLLKYQRWIDGIKIYPTWGYYPYDHELTKYYEWCFKNNKKVISHCTLETPIYYEAGDLLKKLDRRLYPLYYKGTDKKKLAGNFCNPLGLAYISRRYSIKVSAAHLGGYDEILKHLKGERSYTTIILEQLELVDDFYTDISYVLMYPEALSLVLKLMQNPKISHKILGGFDFYMNEQEKSLAEVKDNVKQVLGTKIFNKIFIENNSAFYL